MKQNNNSMETITKAEEQSRLLVCEQVVNMLENNILQHYNIEPFLGWCEDGNIFNDSEHSARCKELMAAVAPHIDKVCEILAVDFAES